jgi:hypothetical protein
MKAELVLRVVLEKPPAGVDFGLQKGRGSGYETIQKQRSQANTAGVETIDLYFQFTVGVKARGNDPVPAFLGPLIQGPLTGRFVYIDTGTYAGQTDTCWSRRLKIPLSGITWELIDQLSDHSRPFLEARVPGTAKDGGPNCGTAKLLDGWKLNSDSNSTDAVT